MIRYVAACLLVLLVLPGVALADAPRPDLTEDERARLVEMLERSRVELEALVARATGEAWGTKPEPEKWSVGEVVEHVTVAEEALLGMIQGALQGEADPEWQTLAAAGIDPIVTTIGDRAQFFQAPERLEPKGEMARDDLLARYAAARIKTLDFVRTTSAPVKRFTAEGPAGKMSAHQWLAVLGAHNLRHNRQIADVLTVIER